MILGLCGLAGSGKDTVADILVKDHDFVKVALADPLKRICKGVFDFTDRQLWGPSEERNKEDMRYLRRPVGVHIDIAAEIDKEILGIDYGPHFLTPRYALQQLGTEWGRNCYKNVWVDYAMRVAKTLLRTDYLANEHLYRYSAQKGLILKERGWVPISNQEDGRRWNGVPKGVVFSDIRFQNEVEAIRAAGGSVWRIQRDKAGLEGVAGAHLSETEQLNIPEGLFTMGLENNGSMDDLVETIRTAIEYDPYAKALK